MLTKTIPLSIHVSLLPPHVFIASRIQEVPLVAPSKILFPVLLVHF